MQNVMKNIINKLQLFFYKKKVVAIFLFSILISLMALCNLLTDALGKPLSLEAYNINTYIISCFNPYKYLLFIKYGCFVFIMALFALCCFFLFKNPENIEKFRFNKVILTFDILYNFLFLFINTTSLIKIFILLFVWIALLIFSFKYREDNYKKYVYIPCFYLLIIVCIIQFISIFYPFVFQKIKIINEFWDIPEITLVKNTYDKNIREIDNIQYITKNKIIGAHSQYDIRNPFDNYSSHCIKYTYSERLQKFLDSQNYEYNQYSLPNKFLYPSDNFFYYKNGELCLIGKIKEKDYIFLKNSSQTNNDVFNLEKLKTYVSMTALDNILYESESDDKLEAYLNFIKNNKHELHWKILNRYYFHHQNHVIAPVNELMHNKNADEIFFQYGKYNGKFIANVLEKLGGFTFTKYMQVTYSFYYIYFFAFAIMSSFFFKKKEYFVSWLMLSVASYNYISDEFLRIAPGTNPMRHFFDIFIFFFIYLYFVKKSKISLFLSVIISAIAILNEANTGIFIMLAIMGTLFIKNFIFDKKNAFEIVMLVLSPILAFLANTAGKSLLSYGTEYFKLGLLGFPTSKTILITICTLIAFFYFMLIRQFLKSEKNTIIYFYTTIFFYVQAVLFYYLWGTDFNHLMVYFPIMAFMIIAFIQLLAEQNQERHRLIVSKGIVVVLILSAIFYGFSLQKQYKSVSEFNNIFKTHKVYEWKLPHTDFISTMNPIYFEDSIKLIQKYSPEESGIYIISKYDSFLPVISDRYSKMPFFEVSNFLTSQKEVNLNIQTLKEVKPQYLFVDRDIDRDYALDIIGNQSTFSYLFYESIWRYQRLLLMKDIFNAVRKDYEPIESSYLLTVWKKRSSK